MFSFTDNEITALLFAIFTLLLVANVLTSSSSVVRFFHEIKVIWLTANRVVNAHDEFIAKHQPPTDVDMDKFIAEARTIREAKRKQLNLK